MSGRDAWRDVGRVAPDRLATARLAAHWGVQPVAAFAQAAVGALPDDSHQSLSWDSGHGCLVSQPSARGSRVAFRMRDAVLVALSPGGASSEELALGGRTLAEAQRWLVERLAALGDPLDGKVFVRPGYDLPAHPVGEGGAFDPFDAEALEELTGWYEGATAEIERVAASRDDASPVRCWPHHFDVATLVTLDPGGDAESARSIGVGMTPGDASYGEPYLYVTPWPYPDAAELPPLPNGAHWHVEGWVGAVLNGTRLVEASDRESAAREFIDESVKASIVLLGA